MGAHHLKKACASRLQEAFALQCVLNNYEFMVHHVPIYRKYPKDFNEEKNLQYFNFYNLFDAYETKAKMSK